MTTALPASSPNPASTTAQSTASTGAVPAQRLSYASAATTKTASPSLGGASAHNAKVSATQMNGNMAQGGSQPANAHGTANGQGDHSRKTSVVINATGANYTNGGGPVGQTGRPPISFGSINAPGADSPAAPFQAQNASLPTPSRDPRVTSPAHSPSPIPQPAASGGKPPAVGQHNGSLAFGQLPADTEIVSHAHLMRHANQMLMSQKMRGQIPSNNMQHERRPSSQSMQSEPSNQGMNMNRNFQPQAGRGRGGGYQNQQFMGSPGPNFRNAPNQPGRNMPPNFQQGGPPGSPFNRPAARASPSPMPAQPHMAQGHQMHYGGYNQHLNPQHQQQVNHHPFFASVSSTSRTVPASSMRNVRSMSDQADGSLEQHVTVDRKRFPPTSKSAQARLNQTLTTSPSQMYNMPQFDASQGYYQPYPNYNSNYYGQQQAPQSPRPNYPSPFPGTPGSMQPPFHPPGTPMQRSGSQASERPPSSLGHPATPAHNPAAPSHTPISHATAGPASASNSFVRPVKKSNAIKITDASGNAVSFAKPSPSPSNAQPQTPVIVSTPNAPTPPPRAPSTQHNRGESKTAKSSEETKNAFAEQVKRQVEENKRKEEEAAAKAKLDVDAEAKSKQRADDEAAAESKAKEAVAKVEAEKAATKAADDKKAEEDAATAKKSEQSDEDEKKRKQEEEDARFEAEIAEMEAREKEEEERERAFQEKRSKEKAAAAEKEKEKLANVDAELKRQEREAEAREEARERERNGETTTAEAGEPDEEAKALFNSLKKPTLGPGADSGTETPASEATQEQDASPVATAVPARVGGQAKAKPAHLKLETSKSVERAEPTPGMQALKSARFLELKEEAKYPDGFKSPNPALNQNQRTKGRAYDKDFLLQFQPVFKEKPSVDWDQKVRDTLGPGDEPGSARSARTPSGMTSRQTSRGGSGAFPGGAMGNFAGPMGARTLPAGTTSQERFAASSGMGGRTPSSGLGSRAPSNLGMGMGGAPGAAIGRTNSSLQMGINSPRQASSRGGRGGSKRDDRQHSKRQDHDSAAKMPLTAHMEIAPLEKSKTGWQPPSVAGPTPGAASGPDASGIMAPDMVQRKVKAALNKMTPEKFDKIADQILDIAAQSKNETDGRTLRQVIQLTFEKACDEAHWAGMYAKFCSKMLTAMSVDIRDETIKDKAGNAVVGGALFRKYLLNRCQEEFERGWQANLPDKPEGEEQEAALLSDEYYVAAAAKRRGLGLIQFIGQLYKLKMLTLRIMHECVMRLLNFEGDPDESAIENLVTLLKSVGGSMEEEQAGKGLLDTYFQRIDEVILKNAKLASRPRFMVMDLIDLRKAGWKGKDDAKGPKTITQIHDEAAAAQAKAEAERSRTSQRGGGGGGRMGQGRGDARNFSGGGMPPPVDYNRTTVGMEDLRRLQNRGARPQASSLGPGGGLGPGGLGGRTGSRRGAGGIGPGSGNTSRTGTPPVDGKKDEPSTAQNAFR